MIIYRTETPLEVFVLSVKETDYVAGGATASYNTPGNPDYGSTPYSSNNGPVKDGGAGPNLRDM